MDKITKRFATFYYPGSFVAETTEEDIGAKRPEQIKFPKGAYCFSVSERDMVVDGPDQFTGKSRRVGPTYWNPDGRVKSLDEVKADPSSSRVLISNMECNGFTHVIVTASGWTQPFDPAKDVLLVA